MSTATKTKGIVLNTTKYSDNSLIARIFTRELGMLSFMVRGAYSKKNKKATLLHACALVELDVKTKNSGGLQTLVQVERSYAFNQLNTEVVKAAISLFVAEILYRSLEQDYQNEELFDFLEQSIVLIDLEFELSNYPIWFLSSLSRFYGFRPDPPLDSGEWYFDMQRGEFYMTEPIGVHYMPADLSSIFGSFLGTNFDRSKEIKMTRLQRQELLRLLISYFQIQIEGLGKINAHEVLETIFE